MSEKVTFKYALGARARDRVSQLTGIIDARCQWLNGCLRYSVQPAMKEGADKIPDGMWVDEAQLEIVDDGINIEVKKNGGPSFSSRSARGY
jgi:hypothetical protein